jgi:hypothetical protein
MTTLAELEKQWHYKGYGYIERLYNHREDMGYLVLICAFGGMMTLFDIIVLVVE